MKLFEDGLHQLGTILVTCGPGLAHTLKGELKALGFKATSFHQGGVGIEGSFHDTLRLNLVLRTAYNVLFLLKEFRCKNPDELYRQTASIPWEDLIPADGYLCVVSRVDTPSITNTMYPNLKVKDAVVDRITGKAGRRPDSGPRRDRVVLQLFWKNDRCWLYLNTSGQKISDRNYRKLPHAAPLREALAAGLVHATGYDGTTPFVTPMCGSGTLAVEAALLAMGKAPGLLRTNFGFMHVQGYDEAIWQGIRTEAQKIRKKETPAPIIATDNDEQAVAVARQNAKTAGVDHFIRFEVCDFAETPLPEEAGIVILNPGYGIRVGSTAELEKTYRRIGDFLKQQCQGYTGYVFTGNPQLAKCVGLRAGRRTSFLNGSIRCVLLQYNLYEGTRKKGDSTDGTVEEAQNPQS